MEMYYNTFIQPIFCPHTSICTKLLIFSIQIPIILTIILSWMQFNKSSNTTDISMDLAKSAQQMLIMKLYNKIVVMEHELKQLKLKNKLTANALNHYNRMDYGNIDAALEMYDADKTGVLDYAAEYQGGCVVSTPDTRPFPSNRCTSMFYCLFKFPCYSEPAAMLRPGTLPGDCFGFYGQTGRIRIRLWKKVIIYSISLEHTKLVEERERNSAPKEFEIIGLNGCDDVIGTNLGRFTYQIDEKALQTFVTYETSVAFEYIEMRILNNYGNPDFTCVYRLRVHSM